MDQAAADLREQLFVADRVGLAQLQLFQAVVVAAVAGALDHLAAVLLERLAVAQQVGHDDFGT
ncbi:MAG: hypothetical protein J0I96_15695 [Rhodanobacter sp.]|nr:hypothetical protein [Rhodanobacter sp.]